MLYQNKRRTLSAIAGALAVGALGGSVWAAPVLVDAPSLPLNGVITGDVTINIAAGQYVSAPDLVIQPGAKLTIVGDGLLQVKSISLAPSADSTPLGFLDIGRAGVQISSMTEDAVRNLVSVALTSNPAKSSGLYSSKAGGSERTGDEAAGVAVIGNRAGGLLGSTQTYVPSFFGMTAKASDVLVTYTYLGDANLDGQVTLADLGIVNDSINVMNKTGWLNGDFNYDGKVDYADFALADAARSSQPVIFNPLGGGLNSIIQPEIVIPEPSGILFVLVGMAPIVRRYRRD